jgi:hypothetical protein
MADEERTPEDMRIVREIADATDDFPRPLTRLNISSFWPPETDPRFENLADTRIYSRHFHRAIRREPSGKDVNLLFWIKPI